MNREIERKWLLPSMPSLAVYGDHRTTPCSIIEQHYQATEHDREERVRKAGTRYTYTTKRGIGIARDEFEQDIGPATFEAYKRNSIASLTKNRYHIKCGNHVLELDQYTGTLSGLVIIEVEFKTEAEAAAFILPDWANGAIEVTTDERYKNKNLALHGIPSTHLCTIQ